MYILKQTKLNPLSLESTHTIFNTFGRKEKCDKSSRQTSSKFGNEPISLLHPSPIKWCYLLPPNYFYSLSVFAVLTACLRSGKDFPSQWKSFLQHAWIALPLACYSWHEIYCRCNNTANKSAICRLHFAQTPWMTGSHTLGWWFISAVISPAHGVNISSLSVKYHSSPHSLEGKILSHKTMNLSSDPKVWWACRNCTFGMPREYLLK